ncbi:hypothetical protein TcWFU_010351 [Taenia crassiceps]|uniref:Mediator of RNA polymerase II transcription subunit 31 n=1 Tax=Taenia crassiceps TaxID=6207 RepID=A0ABR4QIY1_9CEST
MLKKSLIRSLLSVCSALHFLYAKPSKVYSDTCKVRQQRSHSKIPGCAFRLNWNTIKALVLAQQGCFDKPEFINYLAYLQYWKSPSYSRFITYPFCLHMLDLLQSPDFRREVAHESVTRFIDDQMLLHWKNYLRKRAEMVNKHVQGLDAMATPGPGPSS